MCVGAIEKMAWKTNFYLLETEKSKATAPSHKCSLDKHV